MQQIVQRNFEARWRGKRVAAASASAPLLINLTSMLLDGGGNWSPQRKPTQTQKKQSNSTQKGLL